MVDINRAENFIKHDVLPFLQIQKEARNCNWTQIHESKHYQYPIDVMNADQWLPFALCMKQSRLRKATFDTNKHVSPLQMIINGGGGTGKSWLLFHIVKDVHTVFSDQCRRVLIMGHQGTAAYNIGGQTICSMLG